MLRPLVAATLVALALIVTGGGTAVGSPHAPSPATQATRLASKVAGARTSAARYAAVLEVMKALHAPVFTASGKQLTPGSKGLPRGFNLYDFQLRALAGALGRRDTLTLDGFARLLKVGGSRLSASAVQSTLRAGVRASLARRSSPPSLVGLLVRELGLRHRPASDLSRALPADRVTLDPLQTLLIVADSVSRHGSNRYRVVAAARSNPCDESSTPLTRFLGVAGVPIGPALPLWDLLLLEQQLSAITAVTRRPGVHQTHYGPGGHAAFAGRRLEYTIHAEITEDVPDDVRCGYFHGKAGQVFPPKGPLKGAAVVWSETGRLDNHGETARLDERTNAQGDARFIFNVKAEKLPGFGRIVEKTGSVIAAVTPGSGSPPVSHYQPWAVLFHRPRGFTFSSVNRSFTGTTEDGEEVRFSWLQDGRACGDDPYAPQAWTIRETATLIVRGVGGPVNQTYSATFPEGRALGVGFASVELVVTPGRSIQFRFRLVPPAVPGVSWSPPAIDAAVPVTEDTSCPDNS